MEFDTRTKTIQDVFSQKKKIVIPRFQREFVWEAEESVNIFWEDILDNLIFQKDKLITSEYFLGTLVLIDNINDPREKERAVVDGQQRLTAITIFFSALYEIFKKLEEDKLADIIYSYIVTEDNDGNDITLLDTESPKPFFQLRIQKKEKDSSFVPNTNEEKRLLAVYDFFLDKMSEKKLQKEMEIRFNKSFDYIDIIKVIRDQILQCKVVYVSVKSMKDAYMIFEVLNAKGEPLNAVELIKNSIFKELSDTQPIDEASVYWDKIKKNIEADEEIDIFYRHFWLSKYCFVTQKKLFQEFDTKIKKDKSTYKKFLKELSLYSENYKKIINPNRNDWNTIEKLDIYYSLQAFSAFNIRQVRTILLSIFDLYNKKRLNLRQLKDLLLFLENFHFVFSAICSSRPSGLESRYSKYAIKLQNEKDKNKIKNIINDFKMDMHKSIPSYENFLSGIQKLYFVDGKEVDKKKIQYIFIKIERFKIKTSELDINPFSIEHIKSQSFNNNHIGFIGNLLPLAGEINSYIGNKPYNQKLNYYKKSKLQTVKDFIKKYENEKDWTEEKIDNRTKEIAHYLFYDICGF